MDGICGFVLSFPGRPSNRFQTFTAFGSLAPLVYDYKYTCAMQCCSRTRLQRQRGEKGSLDCHHQETRHINPKSGRCRVRVPCCTAPADEERHERHIKQRTVTSHDTPFTKQPRPTCYKHGGDLSTSGCPTKHHLLSKPIASRNLKPIGPLDSFLDFL